MKPTTNQSAISQTIFVASCLLLIQLDFVQSFTTTTTRVAPNHIIKTERSFQSLPRKSSILHLFPNDSFLSTTSSIITSTTETISQSPPIPPATLSTDTTINGLSASTNTIIFIIGLIPFLWATYEFWSRIAVGASFGTGSDSIQIQKPSVMRTIGKDGDLNKSRGRQVLGDGALFVAYVLFAVAIGSVGIAVYSVVSSPPDMM